MYKHLLLITCLLSSITYSKAQDVQVALGYGRMNYQGDLQSRAFTTKLSKPAMNAFVKYGMPNKVVLRAGITLGSVYGDDKFNNASQQQRNLNFRSNIKELQAGAEYHFVNPNLHRFSPYVFGGVAIFHFNPYTYDTIGRLAYLHFFSTEGEGLSEYPNRKKYSLNQIALPFGAGINFRINCMFSISAEITERKLFTDYLDDVSKGYVDYSTLLKEKGPLAVKLAYRGNGPYPDANTAYKRGNSSNKDMYYTGIVTLAYHFNKCGNTKFKGRESLYSCPLPTE